MTQAPHAVCLWSSGKDSAFALWRSQPHYDVRALVTTVTEAFQRVSMHGVRVELLRQQADSLELPLREVAIPYPCPNDEYERRMIEALESCRAQGSRHVLCGDLHLADVRRYREDRLFRPGEGVFPLWLQDTRKLAREMIASGFRAVLCCVDTSVLPAEFAGRRFDEALLADLPATVDPCGENGEFHTFVYDGPNFRSPIPWTLGERVLREQRFAYVDLVPNTDA